MRICVCYICVTNGPVTEDYAARFVTTYNEYPPGVDHDTLIICNGGPVDTKTAVLFSGMNAKMFPRSNDGWDIGGYIHAAQAAVPDYDMLLCVGESNYFHKEGWLKRIADTWAKYGPGMYGPYSSNAVRGHLNTTAFAASPALLRQYPKKVLTRADRYEFEHGEHSLWRIASHRRMPVRLITWDGEWLPIHWRLPHDILWRGSQSNCLMWCNHSDNYRDVDAKTKATWMRSCDRPFR